MIPIDVAFGFLAGVVSCLTPEALLLLPLTFGAARAADRVSVIAPVIGLGLSLVGTGLLASVVGMVPGFDAIWFRRVVCVLLFVQGIVLMSNTLVERFPALTGGRGGVFALRGTAPLGGAFRQFMLALFVGANWVPLGTPVLLKASLLAADISNSGLALVVLFAFGMGAAIPWIVLGRIIQLVLRPFGEAVMREMGGKRLLAVSLLAVALLGIALTINGLDAKMAHRIDAVLPPWAKKLALTF